MESLLAQQAAAAATSMFAGIHPTYRLIPGSRCTPSPLSSASDHPFPYTSNSSCMPVNQSGKSLNLPTPESETGQKDSEPMDLMVVANSQRTKRQANSTRSELPDSSTNPSDQPSVGGLKTGLNKCSSQRPWPTSDARILRNGPGCPEMNAPDWTVFPLLNLLAKFPLDLRDKSPPSLPLPSMLVPPLLPSTNSPVDDLAEIRRKQAHLWQTMLSQLTRQSENRATDEIRLPSSFTSCFEAQSPGMGGFKDPENGSFSKTNSSEAIVRCSSNPWFSTFPTTWPHRMGPSAFKEPTSPPRSVHQNPISEKDLCSPDKDPATFPTAVLNQFHLNQYLKSLLLQNWRSRSFERQPAWDGADGNSLQIPPTVGSQMDPAELIGPLNNFSTVSCPLRTQTSSPSWINTTISKSISLGENSTTGYTTSPITDPMSPESQDGIIDLASSSGRKNGPPRVRLSKTVPHVGQ